MRRKKGLKMVQAKAADGYLPTLITCQDNKRLFLNDTDSRKQQQYSADTQRSTAILQPTLMEPVI